MAYASWGASRRTLSVMRICIWATLVAVLLVPVAGVKAATTQQQPPALLFTDLDSGPNIGGEGVNGFAGAYVTIYGNFIGTSQGSSTITWNGLNCLRVLPAIGAYTGWGMSHLWYQKIVVQLGPSCTAGTGNFVVTVNGQSSNGMPFTVRAGNIYFVATTGNDSTGNGSFAAPFATPKKAFSVMAAGDTMYLEGGVSIASGGSYSALDWGKHGTAGSPVAMVAYPGATPQPFVGGANPQSGNAVRCNTGYSTSDCSYGTIAGIKMQANTSALWLEWGPGSHWRIVANDMTCPNGDGQQGCFTTNQVNFVYFFGNYTHDVSSQSKNSSKQYHSTYFSTDSNHIWVGWNKWFNNYSCRDLQFHSSPLGGGGAGDPTGHNQFDLHVFSNWYNGNRCNAINFATVDPSQGPVEAYNNLITNVGTGPDSTDGPASTVALLIANITNTGPIGTGTIEVYSNTFYGSGNQLFFSFPGGQVENDATTNMTLDIRNNLFVTTNSATSYISHYSKGAVVGSNNEWSGSGNGPIGPGGGPATPTGNINAVPSFVNPGTDFHLQTGSPAIDAGVGISSSNSYNGYQVWGGSPTDHDGVPRPQGSAYDIGAFEYFAGGSTVQKPVAPTGVGVTSK